MVIQVQYGKAITLPLPIIKRGVVDFAVAADWSPSAGDVKLFPDQGTGGAIVSIDSLPTAVAIGNAARWDFALTAARLRCKELGVWVSDAAAKAIEDSAFIIHTINHPAAMHPNGVMAYGLVAGGAAQNVVLPSDADGTTDHTYRGGLCKLKRASGSPGEEWNLVTGYTASSKVAAVARPWLGAAPSNGVDELWIYGSIYNLTLAEQWAAQLALGVVDPMPAEVLKVHGITLQGTGVSGDKMRPA